jgi:hypothetical protein
MKRILAAVFVAISFVGSGAAYGAGQTPPPQLVPIDAAMKAANAGQRAAFVATFTADAAIVDDFAPYRFVAPSAPAHWYDGFLADAAANHVTDPIIVTHPPKFVHTTDRRAWVVMPTDYHYKLDGKAELETGSLVFTLVKLGHAWKISTMSWAALTDSGL